MLAWMRIVPALLLAVACSPAEPYSLRLHVDDDAMCEPYEAALLDAIHLWSDHGVDAFTYDECVVDDYRARPMVRGLPGARGYTTDLVQPADHVPVYAVDEILMDAGKYNVARPLAVGLPSHVVPCPGMVASTLASSIAIAHELGHLLWLDHSNEETHLMYERGHSLELDELVLTGREVDEANGAFDDCAKQRD